MLHRRVHVAQSRTTHVVANLLLTQDHVFRSVGRLRSELPPFAVGKPSQIHFKAFVIVIRQHVPGRIFWLEQPEE